MTLHAVAPYPMARTRTSSPTYEPTPASRALKLRRTELGKSQADVAFDSEVLTQTTVSELERAKYGPEDLTASRLAALARGLNWTVAELEQATGLNLNLSPDPPASRPLTDAERRGGPSEAGVQLVNDLHRIPVRGMAAAGSAFYSEDNILDYEYVTADEYRVGMLAVQIEGDSMEPHVPHGSRVYVDVRLTDPQEGKMFLIHIHGDGFVVKRAKQVGHSWLLLSDNPAYQAFTPDEATVVGQVYFIQPRGWRA